MLLRSQSAEVFGEKRKAFDSAAARLGDIDDSKASELIANARKIEKEKEKAVNGRRATPHDYVVWMVGRFCIL